jgi:HAD superfamily hydrolase (TIGR01509 family)
MLQALIWDLDGTLAETERDGHLVAFNEAFEAHALPWRWSVEDYRRLLQITGGKERLRHDLAARPDAPAGEAEREALIASLHAEKNRRYARIVEQGGIGLRPGVRRLMREALAAHIRLAIATTTTRSNADALLAKEFGPGWPGMFAAVVCGEDAPRRKPDPQVYQLCLEWLDLDPEDAIAIEDSYNGLAAARAAGLPVLVTRSVFFAGDPHSGAMAVCDHLDAPATPSRRLVGAQPAHVDLARLREWHALWWRDLLPSGWSTSFDDPGLVA